MRVKRAEESFPAVWRTAYKGCEKAVYEGDIKFRTLRMKLLVFKTKKDLRNFWETAEPTKYTGKLGDCVGVVSSLSCEVESFADEDDELDPKPHMEVDGRYFAVMALLVGHLGMEVITPKASMPPSPTRNGCAPAPRGRLFWTTLMRRRCAIRPGGSRGSSCRR